MYSVTKAHRFLLRPPAARLRRRLQTPARPQCDRGDRSADAAARRAQHGVRFQRHQADRERLDRRAISITGCCCATTIRSSSRCSDLGEPVFICQSNPTVEHIAQLIFRHASRAGPVRRAREGVGDADLVRGIHGVTVRLVRVRSRRHPRRFSPRSRGLGQRAARRVRGAAAGRSRPSAAWWATARPRWSRGRSALRALSSRPTHSSAFWRFTTRGSSITRAPTREFRRR